MGKTKKRTFLFHLTVQEHALLKRKALQENVSMSEYVRRCVFNNEEDKNVYPTEY